MKSKKFFLLVILLLASFACNSMTQGVPATPTPLRIEPGSLPKGELGADYEVQILVHDNVTPIAGVSILEGALPPGLELAFVDGEDSLTIWGEPEETGSFTFTVHVACFGTMVSGQTAQVEYTIVVE